MDLIILTILILAGMFYYLQSRGWKKRNILSLIFGIGWAFLFFTYGAEILSSVWPQVNAADFFIIYYIFFWGGSLLAAAVPFLKIKDKQGAIKVIKLFFALSLLYLAIDNIGFGPAAVGPQSPYKGQDLCTLNPTFYAEDVFMGCYFIQKAGIDPFSPYANFIVYVLISLVLILIGIKIIGLKKSEKIIYNFKI